MKELNPLIDASASSSPLSSLTDDELKAFRLVVLCDVQPQEMVRL